MFFFNYCRIIWPDFTTLQGFHRCLSWIDVIKVGQTAHPTVCRVHTTIKHHHLGRVLHAYKHITYIHWYIHYSALHHITSPYHTHTHVHTHIHTYIHTRQTTILSLHLVARFKGILRLENNMPVFLTISDASNVKQPWEATHVPISPLTLPRNRMMQHERPTWKSDGSMLDKVHLSSWDG